MRKQRWRQSNQNKIKQSAQKAVCVCNGFKCGRWAQPACFQRLALAQVTAWAWTIWLPSQHLLLHLENRGRCSTCPMGLFSEIKGIMHVAHLGQCHIVAAYRGSGLLWGLPWWVSWWLSWWRIRPQCRRPGFNSWIGKIPWRREHLPTPVFWPEESCGLYSTWGCKELDTTERLSLSL